jgi:16S rRNA (cytosine967-C5)-methyltransferase
MKQMSALALSAKILSQVISEGRSLTPLLQQSEQHERSGLIKALCFAVCRFYPQLQLILNALVDKPMAKKNADIEALLLLGIHQLKHTLQADYAVVSETVACAVELNKSWAKGLINGVLRNYQRKRQALEQALSQNPVYQWAHPAWLLKHIQADWPHAWRDILAANNAQAPMVLRVNRQRCSLANYMDGLAQAGIQAHKAPLGDDGLVLQQAMDVALLPGFAAGEISVQDSAAQLVAASLELQAGHKVLDACAAPGGKTCHMAELQPQAQILALDVDGQRLKRVADNLARLQLGNSVRLQHADAASTQDWWQGELFERILVDAPCSATGVIRRHPDIKLLRREADLAGLCAQQARLLQQLWPLLAPGGILLYCTCSLLQQENSAQVGRFLQLTADARERPITQAWGQACQPGRQLLPVLGQNDGMYLAKIEKTA